MGRLAEMQRKLLEVRSFNVITLFIFVDLLRQLSK